VYIRNGRVRGEFMVALAFEEVRGALIDAINNAW
jgi:hypothetical protein